MSDRSHDDATTDDTVDARTTDVDTMTESTTDPDVDGRNDRNGRNDREAGELELTEPGNGDGPLDNGPNDPEDGDGNGDGPAGRPRRRVDVGLLVACCVIAGGLLLIIWGLTSALTGDDGVDRPDEIEDVSPVENAIQVLQQDSVVVDLQFGLDAVLVVDGIELETSRIGENDDDIEPGQQATTDPSTAVYDPGNARISFRPTENAPIEEWTEGRHTVTVIYWPIEDGRESGTSRYTWSFDVV